MKSTNEYEQEKNELTSPVTLNVECGLPPVSIQNNISDNMSNATNPNDTSVDTAYSAVDTDIESDLEGADLTDITMENIVEEMIRNEETGENEDNGEDMNVNENLLPEVLQSLNDDTEVGDFDLQRITNYSYENGYLYLLCELKSGETILVLFKNSNRISLSKRHNT